MSDVTHTEIPERPCLSVNEGGIPLLWADAADPTANYRTIPTIEPEAFKIICANKEFSKGGCTSCWCCAKCGARGCDNFYWLKAPYKINQLRCDGAGTFTPVVEKAA